MALTPEVLKANEKLATLPEEVITTIATLSANDESSVINTKIGEHHGRIDKDVLEVSGIAKNDGEASYDYVKRAIASFKEKVGGAETLQKEVDTYKTKVADLEKKIADGEGNAVIAQKLKDAEAKLATLTTELDTQKQGLTKKEEEYKKEVQSLKIGSSFEKASSKLKFKNGYGDAVQKRLIGVAQSEILAKYTPDWIEENGKTKLVYRDENGQIALNRTNGSLEPYTTEDLLKESLKDAIVEGKKSGGTGTENPEGEPDEVTEVDISGAKTQVEADDAIVKHLLQKGKVKGSSDFAAAQKELRTKFNISKLPIK